jgi:hypothetical protein
MEATMPNADKSVPPITANVAETAFKETQAELDALDSSDLVATNVNIPMCVTIALGAEPLLQPFVPQIEGQLPHHLVHCVTDLRRYALAAWYAYLASVPLPRGEDAVKTLLVEAGPLREALLVAAEALAHRRLFDPARVAEIRAGHGHVDTANDLLALSSLFSGAWPMVANKTAIEEHEVQRAGAVGAELLVALGEREVVGAKKPPAEAQELRGRAFTLLVRAYNECRRAIAYLRWYEGDADVIAPSLFRRRGQAKPASDPPAPMPVEPPTEPLLPS